ncbi:MULTISPECIES: alpha/beta fold hydrolase [Anoxybacillus]|nr:alpha/beta hydrolase [Anoxybacillus flavithermus]ASA95749.1 alpha/beta hydrolase [Anoxybacillus flavithermus]MBE2904651.1 alpha/beta fold hydrolase [Anoxybacillus flavithermus]MBE2907159.1 alpha/beta fold hydrolase [Anoxybacillus flavithermus]MBE2911697.1 alpha/beta fold hydrolase [Anoxybacillus flavithermus]MBE2912393.1 alpha/beta fold hydrolase [Anoxybacillus flavithermus]
MNILLLPGWGMKGEVFTPLIQALQPSHVTVVAWEHMHDVNHFLAKAKDALTVPSIVIGWSLGSLVALQLAMHEHVQALVCIGGTSRFTMTDDYPIGWHARVVERMKTQLMRQPEKTIQSFIDMLWGEEEAQPFRYMHHHIPDLLLGLDYLLTTDVRDQLQQIDVPLLLIHGERDRICPPQAAQYVYERTNHCTFMLMPNVGHAPHVTQPSMCAHYIQTWLGGEKND